MIIKMTESEFSSQRISEITILNANSIQKVIKRNADRCSVENNKRPGRKRVLGDSLRGDRVLSRLAKKNHHHTLSDLT
jgi:hypothetical protein